MGDRTGKGKSVPYGRVVSSPLAQEDREMTDTIETYYELKDQDIEGQRFVYIDSEVRLHPTATGGSTSTLVTRPPMRSPQCPVVPRPCRHGSRAI